MTRVQGLVMVVVVVVVGIERWNLADGRGGYVMYMGSCYSGKSPQNMKSSF